MILLRPTPSPPYGRRDYAWLTHAFFNQYGGVRREQGQLWRDVFRPSNWSRLGLPPRLFSLHLTLHRDPRQADATVIYNWYRGDPP